LRNIHYYGPYRDREILWDKVKESGTLLDRNIIIGGNLNLTLSLAEVWGSVKLDPLASYFSFLFQDANLIDVCLEDISPKWRNMRVGIGGVAKRLNKFLMSESLVEVVVRYRS